MLGSSASPRALDAYRIGAVHPLRSTRRGRANSRDRSRSP